MFGGCMEKFKKVRLNIFDYLVITILLVIIVYVLIMKFSSSKTEKNLQNVAVYIFCENIPVKAKDALLDKTMIYAGSEGLDFGMLNEIKIKELQNQDKFFNASLNVECKARKNDGGGYIIDGTTYYLGQEIKLFANSTLMSGYIYDITENTE